MRHVRRAVLVIVIMTCIIGPATQQAGQEAWANSKGTLRIAVVGFDRESTAPWEGSTPMLVYMGSMYDPLIAAEMAPPLMPKR